MKRKLRFQPFAYQTQQHSHVHVHVPLATVAYFWHTWVFHLCFVSSLELAQLEESILTAVAGASPGGFCDARKPPWQPSKVRDCLYRNILCDSIYGTMEFCNTPKWSLRIYTSDVLLVISWARAMDIYMYFWLRHWVGCSSRLPIKKLLHNLHTLIIECLYTYLYPTSVGWCHWKTQHTMYMFCKHISLGKVILLQHHYITIVT